MKLSTKGRYGLRAAVDLALFAKDEPISISTIAAREGLSESYLEQLFAKLKKAGIVLSIRGTNGGYQLARSAADISVGDVLRALEGSLEPVECSANSPNESCEAAGSCVTKYVWQKINDSINRTVDEMKMKELVEESKLVKGDASAQKKCDS